MARWVIFNWRSPSTSKPRYLVKTRGDREEVYRRLFDLCRTYVTIYARYKLPGSYPSHVRVDRSSPPQIIKMICNKNIKIGLYRLQPIFKYIGLFFGNFLEQNLWGSTNKFCRGPQKSYLRPCVAPIERWTELPKRVGHLLCTLVHILHLKRFFTANKEWPTIPVF